MASPLAAIWQDHFEDVYSIWGKEVLLRALDNPVVEQINELVAQQVPENQLQGLAILTVAASVQAIDGKTFTDDVSGKPLTLAQRAAEVGTWDDVLIAAIHSRFLDLSIRYRAVIDGLSDPNSSRGRAPSTEPSAPAGSSSVPPSPM